MSFPSLGSPTQINPVLQNDHDNDNDKEGKFSKKISSYKEKVSQKTLELMKFEKNKHYREIDQSLNEILKQLKDNPSFSDDRREILATRAKNLIKKCKDASADL